VPTDSRLLGATALSVMPTFSQIFVTAADGRLVGMALERLAFCLRKRAERETEVYFPSLSSRTIAYKGMLTTEQLDIFYPDLVDERVASAVAVVHSRFSTNTFPSWPLSHPFRFIAHNGEINTVMGNRNWMRAREALLASDLIPGDLNRLYPICSPGASDSASFDEVLELLHLGGRSLPHSVLMMIPEAWQNHAEMDQARRAFYEFHASMMEPWDGPACVVFTDGTQVGAVLDRNGLRPSRYWVTDDGLVVLASEVGVLDIDPATVVRKGRLQPGRMFLVDTDEHRIIEDEEIKGGLASEHPYDEWLHAGVIRFEDLVDREHVVHTHASVTRRQQVFGYTEEERRLLLTPMARTGAEPIGSMGTDTPIAALSDRPRLLFDYFAQLFAQVTNPPLDSIREELVTSLSGTIGPEANLLEPTPASCRQLVLPFPVITNDELAKIRHINRDGDLPGYATHVSRGLYPVEGGGTALAERIDEICAEVSQAIADGARIIVLSDRHCTAELAPIPTLLLTGAVHHHLVREKTRTHVGLVIEAGDVREVHHVALLIGYGAAAVNPYLAMETVEDLARDRHYVDVEPEQAVRNLQRSLGKGVLKVMSKMGVSTVASYTGAQIFEALGLAQPLVDRYFTGTTSKLGGIDIHTVAEEVGRRHRKAYPVDGLPPAHRSLEVGGEYQWRREGEPHLFDPETVFRLQHSTRTGRYDIFKQYTRRVDDQSRRLMTLRGLFGLKNSSNGGREPVAIEEVEPVESIVRRFSTGAMSYGSISGEAHETLAIAMNRIGGRSNTGEGGEDSERLHDPERRSSIKQVASGRFGVTSEYLTNADDLQIKMAQGAKPGEGGQLPGHKVYPWVARTRHSTPGVGLISPPPHHDIYSIEDLAQLIHDLKNSNPSARVHVKLVAETGVGTVAAGVSKAHADVVLISGHDGGTGAAPLTSLKHAGGPWELGLAETQQTLLLNGLRDRIVVQADGQMKTGRDVVVAALLGAEEFGFATAPLVVSGCIMMRVCHLDTCPVGVATQNPVLRARYAGKPEFVVNFFEFIAQEVRELLAELGFRTLEEAVGHAELLDVTGAVHHWKAAGLDLRPVLHVPQLPAGAALHHTTAQDHGLDKALDKELIALAQDALENGEPVRAQVQIRNVNRTVGTMLGHEVTKRYKGEGLPDGTIDITFTGSAGQSFGAFLPRGITLRLEGDANDYVGKGLSGGRLVVRPDRGATFRAEDQIIAGNVIGYGATSGDIFLRGQVGERFCVRNSGATAVVEGVGDHGCEYMTGGRVVVLGSTGRNFAAGMSGGVAFVLDLEEGRVNKELVELAPVDGDAAEELRGLVRQHLEETGSPVAEALLADWVAGVRRFTEVMPTEYKQVLAAKERAEDEGLSEDETTTRMMEALHG
jgi:glutamate synthase (NADPH) large chain